jgi:hypothetical protein
MIVNALKSGLIASFVILLWTIVSNYFKIDPNKTNEIGIVILTVLSVIFVLINSKKSKCHPISIASFQFVLMMLLTNFILSKTWAWIYTNIFF